MHIIEIALLCTQSPASKRPTMSEVILMLTNGQLMGIRQLTRPTLIDHDRRIHIGSPYMVTNIGNDFGMPNGSARKKAQVYNKVDIMEKGVNVATN